MSAISPTPSFRHGPVRPWWKDCSGLTEYLREVSLFLKRFRSRSRAGHHSRSPLHLVRFHLDRDTIWCDWVARDPDPWDAMLPERIGRRHASLQALKDAVDTRALIFSTMQQAQHVEVRVFRSKGEQALEPIILGSLRRNGGSFRHIHSLAMRAKLLGFQFRLEDEVLAPLQPEDHA